MNKLHLLVLCLSRGWGGLEIHVRDYVRWLAARSDVELSLALHPGGRLREELAQAKARTLLLAPRLARLPWACAGKLAAAIDRGGIEIVHSHMHQDLPLSAFARLRSKGKPALVHTQHIVRPKNAKADPYHRFIYGSLAGFIGVSRALAADAERRLPLKPGVVRQVYPGVPPPVMDAAAAAGPLTVGVVATIWRGKGHHLALQAAAALRQRGLPVRVVFSGRIDQQDYFDSLQAYAREHGLDLEVRGFVAPARAFSGIDVLAMCSLDEPFGMVTVEAMRRGIAVVGSDSGGTAEIIRDGIDGLLFAPGDAQALARQIERLAGDDALRQRLCSAAAVRAGAEFDERTQFARILQTVRDCAGQGAHGARPG
ncbi:MAG: glycosyltransferase family 4 protein [Nevskia sp.]|nr:glycosyltransferase family 4 protein [Nevskia sp.]